MASLLEDGPAGLERYRPRLEYFLLDEGRIAGSELESLRNVAAALFCLERSREPRDLKPVVGALLEWLKQPEHKELQRSFASWICNVLLRARMPGVEIAEMGDLLEVNTMLANRVVEWTQEWERQGADRERQEALSGVRAVLVRHLEARFGPLSEGSRERLDEIDSIETLAEMIGRVPMARSLNDLGLE